MLVAGCSCLSSNSAITIRQECAEFSPQRIRGDVPDISGSYGWQKTSVGEKNAKKKESSTFNTRGDRADKTHRAPWKLCFSGYSHRCAELSVFFTSFASAGLCSNRYRDLGIDARSPEYADRPDWVNKIAKRLRSWPDSRKIAACCYFSRASLAKLETGILTGLPDARLESEETQIGRQNRHSD